MQNVNVNLEKKTREIRYQMCDQEGFCCYLVIFETVVSISGCKATETFFDLTIFQQVADSPASQPYAN